MGCLAWCEARLSHFFSCVFGLFAFSDFLCFSYHLRFSRETTAGAQDVVCDEQQRVVDVGEIQKTARRVFGLRGVPNVVWRRVGNRKTHRVGAEKTQSFTAER